MNKKPVALVTGGTKGIGYAIANALTNENYFVIANYSKDSQKAKEVEKENSNITTKRFDVSNNTETKNAIEQIYKTYGHIDVLINNAGIIKDKFTHKMDINDWESVLNTNLNSAFHCTRNILPKMREKNFGRIISLSSVNALQGQVGQSNYCASKAGLIGFTKAIALENAKKNITANVVAPGYIETEMLASIDPDIIKNEILKKIPQGRLGRVNDIAKTILFLISSDYITGETISINGGMYMK